MFNNVSAFIQVHVPSFLGDVILLLEMVLLTYDMTYFANSNSTQFAKKCARIHRFEMFLYFCKYV